MVLKDEGSSFVHHDDSPERDHISTNDTKPRSFTYWRVDFVAVFISISFGYYAAFLGTSPTWNLLLSNVPAEMGQGSSLNWAYPTLLVSQTLSSILFGRLSDLVGRRWVFVLGNLVAFVGFLATGRVSERASISGLAALVGLGTGVQIIGPFLALAELVPVRQRFTVVGSSMSLLAPLFAMNPAIAEALFQNTSDSWRWPYSINAILSFVATLGLAVYYHPPTYQQLHDDPNAEHLKSKDWTGLVVLTLALGSLTYFLLWGNSIFAWDTPQMITLITVSGLVLVSFLLYQFFFGHEYTAYPPQLLRSWAVVSHMLLSSLTSLLLWFVPSAIPVLFRGILTQEGMVQAWGTSSWSSGVVSGFILASLACIKPKFVKWHSVSGVTVSMVILSGLAAVTSNRPHLARAFLTLTGIGQGYALLISGVTTTMVVHRRDIGLVAGLASGFRNLFYAVLQSVFLAIFQPRLQSTVLKYVGEAALEGGLPQTSLPALFEALIVAQATGDLSALLEVSGITPPLVQAVMAEAVRAATDSWKFLFELANIYFIGTIIIAVLSANTDKFLSSDIWAHLGNH